MTTYHNPSKHPANITQKILQQLLKIQSRKSTIQNIWPKIQDDVSMQYCNVILFDLSNCLVISCKGGGVTSCNFVTFLNYVSSTFLYMRGLHTARLPPPMVWSLKSEREHSPPCSGPAAGSQSMQEQQPAAL